MREPSPQVPDHLRPLAPPASQGWLWQVPLGVVLTLGALYGLAGMVDHCADHAAFCAPEQAAPGIVAQPDSPTPPAPQQAPATLQRPILALAFAPLPLAMADKPAPLDFTLPGGLTVADAATQPGAITLDQMNLIAVVEADGLRHALVRLPDGRILRVREGDRLQDATVAAIGDRTLYMLRPDNTPRALVLGG